MSRVALIAGLFAGVVLTGCQSIQDLFGSKQGAVGPGDGGSCTKETRDVLLASLNQTCSVTSQCPSGAFCDPSVGGFCNFQCYDDSECPAGSSCDCIGQCVGASSADGGPPPDPACPRNPTLIASLVTTPRACTFDDACPYGMFCDTQVGKCARDCVQDSDCTGPADAGAPFCNCLGHCSTPGAKPVHPAAVLPSLAVFPSFIQLPLANGATPPVKPSFQTSTLQVSIRAQGTDPTAGPAEKIHVSAGKYLVVQCPAASCTPDPQAGTTCPAPGMEPFVKECDLQNWVWTTNNTSLLASFSLNVMPSSETPQPGEVSLRSWPVTFQSNGIEGNVVVANVGYLTTTPNSIGGTWQSPPQNLAAGYEGRITIDLPGGVGFDTPIQAQPTDYGDGLTLFDPTYVLSPSGLMTIPLTWDPSFGNPSFFWLNQKLPSNQLVTKGVDGWLWGTLDFIDSTFTFQQNTQDGSIQGSFLILVHDTGTVNSYENSTVSVSFQLKPQAIRSCRSAPGQCSTVDGYSCNSGFCTQRMEDREPSFIVPMIGDSKITSSLYNDWYAPTVFGAPGFQYNVLCQYDAGAGLALDAHVSFPIQEASGDLSCVSPTNPGGSGSYPPPIFSVPLLVHQDLVNAQINQRIVSPPPKALGAQELFDGCLADLAIRPPPLTSLTLNPIVDSHGITHYYLPVQSNFGQGRYYDSSRPCLSLGYFVAAAFNTSSTVNPRLHLRILQQWLELHSFVARQGLQTSELDAILAAAQSTAPGGDPNLSVHKTSKSEVIDIVTRGIAFVMSEFQNVPFVGYGYNSEWLNSPDYRQDFGGTPPTLQEHPEYEQGAGLPTTMLETGAAYLDLVNAFVNDADVASYDEARNGAFVASRDKALRVAGDASRFVTEFYDLAAGIHNRALCSPYFDPGCSDPPLWEGRWQQAIQEVNAARARLLKTVSRVAQARNPLDIAENDVPLFFGDPQGATSQFFASSDYLLNTWAAPAVSNAQRDLAGAREAWIGQQNSHLQDTLLEAERSRRLEGLAEQYGRPIIENCGLTNVNGRAIEGKDVLAMAASGSLDLSNCFVDASPACVPAAPGAPDPGPGHTSVTARIFDYTIATITSVQIKSQVCMRDMLKTRIKVTPEILECASLFSMGQVPPGMGGGGWRGSGGVTIDQGNGTFTCDGSVTVFINDLLKMNDLVTVDPAELLDAEAACNKKLDFARIPVPAIQANCLHGKMGEAYSQIITAKNELNTASAAVAAKQVALDGVWNNCTLLAEDEQDRQAAQTMVDDLRDFYSMQRRGALDRQYKGEIWSAIGISGGSGGLSSGFNLGTFFGAGSSEALTATNARESTLLTNYQELLVNQGRGEQMVACFNQADSIKAEVDAAKQVMTSRASAIDTATIALANLVRQNVQQAGQGQAVVAREAGRPFAGYSHDFWLNDKIAIYRRDFQWAQRLAYLAMRAVEYEFQESLGLRNAILSATNADQLQAVVLSLQQEQAARTINRRRPEQQSLVLSLRDDLLRIPSSTGVAAGERAWTAAQKFEGRLSHPQYTVRDINSNWLGQGVEFAVDALAGGAQSGVSLVNRCAERLWRVTATIQGDSLSTSQPGSPVFLLKRNTFQSQWCDGQGDGSAVQVASIQPSHALFSPSDLDASIDDATGFTGSALYPYFNVPRSQFYMSTYQTGSSDELAGRGLYGDYVLLFPKELIEAGFPLGNVEDVLLRFDYYSIDNLPRLAQ